MGNKILFPQLVTLVSEETETQKRQTEVFLKAAFLTISEVLEQHESVKIKGLGSFKLTHVGSRKSVDVSSGNSNEIPAHLKIVFLPEKYLCEEINKELSWFEITEITADKSGGEKLGEELEKEFGEIEPVEPFGPIEPDSPLPDTPEPNNTDNKMNTDHNEGQTEQFQASRDDLNSYASKSDLVAINKNIKRLRLAVEDEEERSKKRSRRNMLVTIIVCAALMTGGFFIVYGVLAEKIDKLQEMATQEMLDDALDNQREIVEPDSEAQSTGEEVSSPIITDEEGGNSVDLTVAPTQPSDIKAMDKITNTRYLTTMAKEHYGNYNLWPYIYLENQSKLGHPDRIKPGTPIVIPNIEKYGVDPKNAKDIEKAKRLGVEIYKKFGNK